VRIAFAGTPEFAVPALEALSRAHQLVGVLTQPDRPRGRGRHPASSAVKHRALDSSLPIAQPISLRDPTERAVLEAWRPDALVVVAYGLLLPSEVLSLPPLGCINLHASLLPRWRGAAPVQRALLSGDARTGVSIMQMDAGLDTGPVLLQRSIPIEPDITAGLLENRLAQVGAEMLIETLAALTAGTLVPQAQPLEGVSYASKLTKAEAAIDWNQSAERIERQVRAFNPRPIAESRLGPEVLRIFSAHALPEAPSTQMPPGTVLEVRPDAVVVACGAGQLAVTALQRPGRAVVSARDFANAHRSLPGRPLGASA
jgi:methionyl-tRNA formyltransferase